MRGVNMSVYYGAVCLKVAIGNEEWGMRNEEWGMRNEEWGMRSEEWGMRSEEWEANFAIAKLQSLTKVLIISLKYYFGV